MNGYKIFAKVLKVSTGFKAPEKRAETFPETSPTHYVFWRKLSLQNFPESQNQC